MAHGLSGMQQMLAGQADYEQRIWDLEDDKARSLLRVAGEVGALSVQQARYKALVGEFERNWPKRTSKASPLFRLSLPKI